MDSNGEQPGPSSSSNTGNRRRRTRGWPSSTGSRRGVATGFRNFCITNEHPDGIVFCEPEIGAVGGATSSAPPNVTVGAAASNAQGPGPRQRTPSSSSSSSIVSCSSGGSPNPASPCLSDASGSGTTITLTSSSDEDYDIDAPDEAPPSRKVKKESKKDDDGHRKEGTSPPKVESSEPRPSTSKSLSSGSKAKVAPTIKKEKGDDTRDAPRTGNENDDVPQFLHHKKFHYKTRTSSAPPSRVSSAAVPSTSSKSYEETSEQLNVDDLKLSPYITREQAEERLRAIGNVEETQREIDAFAAIICTGAMFRMKMVPTGNPPEKPQRKMATAKAPPQSLMKNVGNEKQEIRQQVTQAPEASRTIGVEGRGASKACSVISSGASIALGNGGNVVSINKAPPSFVGGVSEIGRSEGATGSKAMRPEKERMPSGGGGYFQITSPGQASVASDDYEWISD